MEGFFGVVAICECTFDQEFKWLQGPSVMYFLKFAVFNKCALCTGVSPMESGYAALSHGCQDVGMNLHQAFVGVSVDCIVREAWEYYRRVGQMDSITLVSLAVF
jgi:hypothetical protein